MSEARKKRQRMTEQQVEAADAALSRMEQEQPPEPTNPTKTDYVTRRAERIESLIARKFTLDYIAANISSDDITFTGGEIATYLRRTRVAVAKETGKSTSSRPTDADNDQATTTSANTDLKPDQAGVISTVVGAGKQQTGSASTNAETMKPASVRRGAGSKQPANAAKGRGGKKQQEDSDPETQGHEDEPASGGFVVVPDEEV